MGCHDMSHNTSSVMDSSSYWLWWQKLVFSGWEAAGIPAWVVLWLWVVLWPESVTMTLAADPTSYSLINEKDLWFCGNVLGSITSMSMWHLDTEGISSMSLLLQQPSKWMLKLLNDVYLVSGLMPISFFALPWNRQIIISQRRNNPIIRRMGISIYIRRAIYHYLLWQSKFQNFLSKQEIWNFFFLQIKQILCVRVYVCMYVYTYTHTEHISAQIYKWVVSVMHNAKIIQTCLWKTKHWHF